MSEERQIPQEYYKDFPEAPFSDTFKWVDVDGFEHMVTIRSWSANSGMGAIAATKKLIEDAGGKPANVRPQPAAAPQPDPAAKAALEAGNKQLAAELQTQGEAVPAAPNGQAWNTVDVNEVRIEPKADGFVSVEFWQTGRKYAEEYVKWKPENVKALLRHIMTVPVSDDGTIKPAILSCPCRVYFTLGKEKTGPNAKPGSRWHDVAHVRPL